MGPGRRPRLCFLTGLLFLCGAASLLPAQEPAPPFDIVEVPKAWVKRIEFRGNTVFPDGALKDEMKSRERGWLPFLSPGKFDRSVFREDLSRIEEKYYQAGYLDATVDGYWTYGKDFRSMTLHVLLYEGPPYRVERIQFVGNTIFRDDELMAAIPIAEGEPLLPREVEEAKGIIARMYSVQGYVDVGAAGKDTLREELVLSEEKPTLEVRFHIVEGEPVFVRRIRVEGLTKTDELVVLRNLTFHPGDRVNADRLRESETVLRNTGYFDLSEPRAVEISLEPAEGALRDAIVRVKEGATGALFFGLGISSGTGIMGDISFRERNFDITNRPSSWRDLWRGNAFRGGGQRLEVHFRAGTERRSFGISFLDPSVDNSIYSRGGELYLRLIGWDQFELSRTGASVSFGKQLGRHVSRRFEVGYESVAMSNLAGGAPPQISRDKGSYKKPYASLTYTLDKRDNPIVPSAGYLARLSVEMAFLDVETIRVLGDLEKHWTVLKLEEGGRHLLGLRGRAGVMESYAGKRIPVFERFYAGGMGSLRGFEPWGVSPVEPVMNNQVGGQSMLVGSAEYSIPLIKNDVRLAAFLDAGYVEEEVLGIFSGWDNLRASVGIGVRWQISVLGGVPFSLDVAFPVMKEDEDVTRRVHFSLGMSHWF